MLQFFCLRPLRKKIIKKIIRSGNCCSFMSMSNNHPAANTQSAGKYWSGKSWEKSVLCSRTLLNFVQGQRKSFEVRRSANLRTLNKGSVDEEQKKAIAFNITMSLSAHFTACDVHFGVHAYLLISIYIFCIAGSFPLFILHPKTVAWTFPLFSIHNFLPSRFDN